VIEECLAAQITCLSAAGKWSCPASYIRVRCPIPVVVGRFAAPAKIHAMMLGFRNDADVAGLGTEVLNPFKPGRTLPRHNSMRLAAVI